jgi:hypothetical protein
MVEFLVVLMPLLLLFLCILELARYSIASLMLQRAAGIAVRACAVIKDQPLHCDNNSAHRTGQDPDQDASIWRAAVEAVKPWTERELFIERASCETQSNAAGSPVLDGNGRLSPTLVAHTGSDRVDVKARFRCIVPLARDIVCSRTEPSGSPLGAGERSRPMTASAKYAHQGARYDCWYSRELQLAIPPYESYSAPEFF